MKPIAFLLLITAYTGLLASAQETCFKACTRDSGINECPGSTPHDDEAWTALDTSVHTCYCDAAVLFSVCSPGCSTLGFSADAFGRSLGQWRYIDGVCNSTVASFTATAVISTNSAYNPAYTVPYSGNLTAAIATPTASSNSSNSTPISTTLTTPIPTATPLSGSSSSTPSTSSSSPSARTIALAVSLSIVGAITITAALWLLLRRRRRVQLTQNIYETRNAMVIVVGPDGLPMSPDAPEYPPEMRDPNNENVKRWIAEQQEREPDLSVGYTLWTDTELALTDAGDMDQERERDRERDREREMETIVEFDDGEGSRSGGGRL
ncbi:hypothetical protein DFP73DRAFT_569555 [Morchella snyderi]|nr:hypothetical protein DFP73DRAFT_569555 [Morchella snyderi]